MEFDKNEAFDPVFARMTHFAPVVLSEPPPYIAGHALSGHALRLSTTFPVSLDLIQGLCR